MIWRVLEYLKYLFRSIHLHGIHSPFVFELNDRIFRDQTPYYCFDEIESIRAKLLLTHKEIYVNDLGAGSKSNNKDQRKISEIAKNALKRPKKAQLLFRLVRDFEPNCILELGTSLGITTSYLAKANSRAKVITIEGASEVAKVAKVNLQKLNVFNVKQVVGNFNDVLDIELGKVSSVDFVFFDGNHQKEATLSYFEKCLSYVTETSIFVFDDIYWSKGMKDAWKQIKADDRVKITVDCFEFGLVFFRSNQAKEHFTVYH